MASGKTHEQAALTTLAVGGAVAYFTASETAWYAVAGLLAGTLVTPDIDMDTRTREERRWKYVPAIGPLLKIGFWLFWLPYAKMFAHRGLSHVPIIGTVSRILYALVVLWIFMVVIGWNSSHELHNRIQVPMAWPFIYGWILQDNVHLLLDAKKAWHLASMLVLIILMISWGISYAL